MDDSVRKTQDGSVGSASEFFTGGDGGEGAHKAPSSFSPRKFDGTLGIRDLSKTAHLEVIMNNPEVKCDKCDGFGKICYDDALNITMTCDRCNGARTIRFNGKQLALSLERINTWLDLTGNELRLRKYRGKWEAQVFNQDRIGLGEGDTMQEALTKAFDMAIKFMNDEYLERAATASLMV